MKVFGHGTTSGAGRHCTDWWMTEEGEERREEGRKAMEIGRLGVRHLFLFDTKMSVGHGLKSHGFGIDHLEIWRENKRKAHIRSERGRPISVQDLLFSFPGMPRSSHLAAFF